LQEDEDAIFAIEANEQESLVAPKNVSGMIRRIMAPEM
jgi:hypothetical protein